MKIRTSDELFDRLNGDLSWRKMDLITQRKAIISNKGQLLGATLLRSAIPIIYAHWEGFVKEASISYFNFIATKRLSFNQLNKGILSCYISETILQTSESGQTLKVIDFFEKSFASRSDLKKIPSPIKTKSNLNSEVLREIIETLDLNYTDFEAYKVLLDGRLLEARNKIAHGEYRQIDYEFYDEVYQAWWKLVENFKSQIENSVVRGAYKR